MADENRGDLEGVYLVKKGWVESQEIGTPLNPNPQALEEIGQYKIYLERTGWDKMASSERARIQKRLVVSGVFHGSFAGYSSNPSPFPLVQLNHVLGNEERTGAIYTQNDSLIPSTATAKVCDATQSLLIISGQDQVNPIQGIGVFSGLTGGKFVLNSTINQCTLQNDFQFVPTNSFVCFGTNTVCPN
jgi:hypothetical protein